MRSPDRCLSREERTDAQSGDTLHLTHQISFAWICHGNVQLIAIAVEGHEEMFPGEGFLQRTEDVPLHMADGQVDKSDAPTAGQLFQQEGLRNATLFDQRMDKGSSEPLGECARSVKVGSVNHPELFD